MNSVWSERENINRFDSLKGNAKTGVLIIGGGMAGILTAYFLDKAGVNYMLIEGDRIGSGITKNTTAKITSQHGLIYNKLIRNVGMAKAQEYLKANENAIKIYKELSKEIDCDFEVKSAYTYSLKRRGIIEDEIKAVESLGHGAKFCEEMPIPIRAMGAIEFENQAQFHPLKFINGIAKGLNIFENTFVNEMAKNEVTTNHGTITADKIIVATHFPILNKHGSYFIKMYQHRSYVVAYENAPKINGMYVDEAQEGMSFRNYKNLLFIGGGDHRTGKQGGNWGEIRNFAKINYPNAKEKYAWATQDCMSLDGIPYIGEYSKRTGDLYVATGFNKWGMTTSMVAAELLCDLVMGKKNDLKELFSPSRSIIKPQLFVNGFEATVSMLTPTAKRCPHLGCALKWNKAEHSWDCPCHGSRFDEKGKLLDNPATGTIEEKE